MASPSLSPAPELCQITIARLPTTDDHDDDDVDDDDDDDDDDHHHCSHAHSDEYYGD